MRRINSQRLRQWVIEKDHSVAQLSIDTGISFSWLQKALAGKYQCEPREKTVYELMQATGLKEDELLITKRARKS